MKKSDKGIRLKTRDRVLLVVIIVISLFTIVMNSVQMLRTLNGRIEDAANLRLYTIRADLQETLNDDQSALNRFSDGIERALKQKKDWADVESYIRSFQSEQMIRTDGANFNCYAASEEFICIPNFDMPEDYHAEERLWYVGARDYAGGIYVTEPYIDRMSGEICFTMSKMLSDGKTVIAMDFTLSAVQKSIEKMIHEEREYTALIITADHMIVGYSDMSYVGEFVEQKLQQYENIVSKVVSSRLHESFTDRVNGDNVTVFSNETDNGWYMILSVNNTSLYGDTYRAIMVRSIVLVLVLIVVVVLFLLNTLRRRKAEYELEEKTAHLSGITRELKDPLKRIVKLSDAKRLENSADIRQSMEEIKESGLQLSSMMDNLQSYEMMAREDPEEPGKKREKQDISRTIRIVRFVIVFLFMVTMALNVFLNIRQGRLHAGNLMDVSIQQYGNQVQGWLKEQDIILNMFAEYIVEDPDILNDYDRCVAWMNGIARNHSDISVCYMANPYAAHTVIMNNGWQPDAGWYVEERQWYKDTIRSENGYSVSAPYMDEQTGKYCITVSRIVNGKNNEFLGVFGIDFFMEKLVDILGASYDSHSYAFLADSSGIVLNHPNKDYQMSIDHSVNVADTEYSEIRTDDAIRTLQDYDGERIVAVRTKIGEAGLYLYTVCDWFYVYFDGLLWTVVSTLLLLIIIMIVNSMVNRIFRWQNDVNRRLKESADYATRAGRAKSEFLAQMSHEIRTPINVVIGMNEMILRESDDTQIREYSENIQTAGRTLLELVNSILDFSKIEEGKMEIRPVKYETEGMIDYLVNMIDGRAEKKGLAFVLDIAPELPKSLFGDDVRVKQIIINLLTNAVKYTHQGTVTLRMRGETVAEDVYALSVSVEDTGIGIRKEDIERLFISFERLEEERNRNIEGTGLGISIVQGLLTRMDSKLNVESEYGKGSRFSFTIRQGIINPTPIGPYSIAKREKNGLKKVAFKVKNASVLVVDDNDMNLKVAQGLMKLFGIVPELAQSGKETLQKARKKRYDLIFLDHMMPGMDGIETLRKLTQEDLVYDTPVICLTANAIAGVREKYIDAGFSDYLTKPIELSELEIMLEKYIPEEMRVAADRKESDDARGEKETLTEPASEGEGTSEAEYSKSVSDIPGFLAENGIDAKTGIEYAAGSVDFYLEVLQSFVDGYEEKAEAIRLDFDTENWVDYRIRVHALKSTAKMIGDTALAEAALAQENAAKEDRIDAIRAGYEPLMERYKATVLLLEEALKKKE